MRKVPPALALRMRPAARVFADLGFDDARIEDLTEATGVPSSTLYYYFDGKRDVLAFLLDDFIGNVTAAVEAARSGPGNARGRLELVIRTQLRLMAEQPDTCRVLLAELGRLGRLPDTAKAVTEAFHAPVQELLTQGARDGSLRSVPPELTASAIFGAVTLTGLHYVVAQQPVPSDDIADGVLDLLGQGFLADPEPDRR